MALPLSGPLSLNQIHVEAGGTSGTSCSLNEVDVRGLINKAVSTQNAISEYYGASNEVELTSGGTINGINQRKEITASDFIDSGGTLRIPSNMWIWSDNTSKAALTIDIPCTIINEGKIIGKGGQGGSGIRIKNLPHPTVGAYNSGYNTVDLGTGSDGGPAIKINSNVSGVTITNSTGAYIAGGGGGGGASGVEPQNTCSGGGGGAGGGEGGFRVGPNSFSDNRGSGWPNYTTEGPQYSEFGIVGTNCGNGPGLGYAGELNQRGWWVTTSLHSSGGYYTWTKNFSHGYAGGSGVSSSGEDQTSASGRGGGRMIPGLRHSPAYGPYGGGGGEAGADGGAGGNSGQSGGGGGWGAAGGKGYRGAFTSTQCQGGAGGKAVEDSSNTYTLNNSGTIYGATT